jgi:hypothetical protein
MKHREYQTGIGLAAGALLLTTMMGCSYGSRDEIRTTVELNGKWKFEIGDDSLRSREEFDDTKWEEIRVPSAWEDAGFPGYDGYAWYRKHFTAPSTLPDRPLFLTTGPIDDVDQMWVNGHLVGVTGEFPPHFETAYNVDRRYRVVPQYLHPGADNVIAVRVYDDGGAGGFLWGHARLVNVNYGLDPDLPILAGWKIRFGDDMAWKEPGVDDQAWTPITVPGAWESQGYPDYNGLAWYRVRFTAPSELADQKLILLLGKIDDFDEAYLNGERVGKTGVITGKENHWSENNEYAQLRAYFLPPGALKIGQENVLAVRVYDGYKFGGICEGPIGIVRRDQYQRWKNHTDRKDRFEEWFN